MHIDFTSLWELFAEVCACLAIFSLAIFHYFPKSFVRFANSEGAVWKTPTRYTVQDSRRKRNWNMAFISHNSLPYWVEKIESVTLRKWEFARLSPRLELKRAPNREKGFVRYFIKIQGCELKLGYPIWPFPLPISEPRLSPSFSSSLHSFRISLSRPTANYFFFVLVFIKSFTRASFLTFP